MRRGELVLFMKMHSVTELDVDGMCGISRDDWGKEFCLIFYHGFTIRILYALVCHAQKYIGLNGFFEIDLVTNCI